MVSQGSWERCYIGQMPGLCIRDNRNDEHRSQVLGLRHTPSLTRLLQLRAVGIAAAPGSWLQPPRSCPGISSAGGGRWRLPSQGLTPDPGAIPLPVQTWEGEEGGGRTFPLGLRGWERNLAPLAPAAEAVGT